MLESNTFRSMMLILGVITTALFVTGFFVAPLVELDGAAQSNYERVMNESLDGEDHITAYQALQFTLKGRVIGAKEFY